MKSESNNRKQLNYLFKKKNKTKILQTSVHIRGDSVSWVVSDIK